MVERNWYERSFGLLMAIAVAVAVFSAGAANAAFEEPPLALDASEFLSKSQLSGEGFSVNGVVSGDGFKNTYVIESDYGDFTVTGTDTVLARLQEIRATQALEKLENSEEFKDAAKGAVTGMVEGGKALVTSPVETTKGAARGVGRWLSNMGSSISSDDPHQDNLLETAVGYDAVKRGYAVEMGVDPYTDFQPFQERLSEVAKASTAGNLVTSMAINVGTEGTMAGTVTRVAKVASMNSLLKDNPPSSLTRINMDRLLEMGIAGHQAEALLKNYNYTPAEITILVEALRQMGDTQGREIIVTYASSAPDDEVARFMMRHAVMLQRYITRVGPARVVAVAGSAWLVSEAGSIVGVFPGDYLAWVEGVASATDAAAAKSSELGLKGKELFIRGPVSDRARAELAGRGWKVTGNARFDSPDDEEGE